MNLGTKEPRVYMMLRSDFIPCSDGRGLESIAAAMETRLRVSGSPASRDRWQTAEMRQISWSDPVGAHAGER